MVLHSKYLNKYFIVALKEHYTYHCLLCNVDFLSEKSITSGL